LKCTLGQTQAHQCKTHHCSSPASRHQLPSSFIRSTCDPPSSSKQSSSIQWLHAGAHGLRVNDDVSRRCCQYNALGGCSRHPLPIPLRVPSLRGTKTCLSILPQISPTVVTRFINSHVLFTRPRRTRRIAPALSSRGCLVSHLRRSVMSGISVHGLSQPSLTGPSMTASNMKTV